MKNDVYRYDLVGNIKVEINSKSQFRSILDEHEKELIVHVYEEYKKCEVFNNPSMRLDGITEYKDTTMLELSEISFYDFILTNMISMEINEFDNYISNSGFSAEVKMTWSKLKETLYNNMNLNNFNDILYSNILSNTLAVSILIKDIESNFLLTERNTHLAVGGGLHSVSVTGSVEPTDCIESTNPILNCVVRKVKDELNLDVSNDDISVREIVMSADKKQPAIIVDICTKHKISQIESHTKENRNIHIVDKSKLKDCIENTNFTKVSLHHINLHI